ncbi:MAG: hypothetical protein AAGA96_20420 [Verrucomicrobiota bacterium]
MRFPSLLLAVFAIASQVAVGSSPDPASSQFGTTEEVQLPWWDEGECRESFDIRIWPEETVIWLERENLRDMIADPETPAQEREALKRVLALQRAWLRL